MSNSRFSNHAAAGNTIVELVDLCESEDEDDADNVFENTSPPVKSEVCSSKSNNIPETNPHIPSPVTPVLSESLKRLIYSKTEIHSTDLISKFESDVKPDLKKMELEEKEKPTMQNWDIIRTFNRNSGGSTVINIKQYNINKVVVDYNHGLPVDVENKNTDLTSKRSLDHVEKDNKVLETPQFNKLNNAERLLDENRSSSNLSKIKSDEAPIVLGKPRSSSSSTFKKTKTRTASNVQSLTANEKLRRKKNRTKRKRKHLTSEQLHVLQKSLKNNRLPDKFEKERLANLTGLRMQQITDWFGNHKRMKTQQRIGSAVHSYLDEKPNESMEIDPTMPKLIPESPFKPNQKLTETEITTIQSSSSTGLQQINNKNSGKQIVKSRKKRSPENKQSSKIYKTRILKDFFYNKSKKPIPHEIKTLVKKTGLDKRVVEKFFQTMNENESLSETGEYSHQSERSRISSGSRKAETDNESDMSNQTEYKSVMQFDNLSKLSLKALEKLWSKCTPHFEKLMALITDDCVSNTNLKEDSKQLRNYLYIMECPFSDEQSHILNSLNVEFVRENREEIWDMGEEDDDDALAFVEDTLTPWSVLILYAKLAKVKFQDAVYEFAKHDEPYDRDWTIPSILDNARNEFSE